MKRNLNQMMFGLGATALTAMTLSTSAASLTFETPVAVVNDTVLDAPLAYSGATLAQAVNFGSSGSYSGNPTITTANQTINFTLGGGVNLDQPGTSTTTILYNAGSQVSASLFPGTTGNAAFDGLLRSDGWHNNASDAIRPLALRLGGLTVGNTYVFSLFTADARSGSAGRMQQYFDTFSAGVFSGGSSVSFSQNPATMVLGYFTADAVTQDIFVQETDGVGNDDTHLAAFTLYSVAAVPEPTAAALFGLGGLATLMVYRRQRK